MRKTGGEAARDLANSPESIAARASDKSLFRRAWLAMGLRCFVPFALLLAAAGMLAARGVVDPFGRASAGWLWYLSAANAASLGFLAAAARREGLRMRDLYCARGSTWKGDLAWLAGFMVVSGVLSMVPGFLLAEAFWGGSSIPNNLLFGPLPEAAVYPLFLLVPAGQGLAELPLYWGYAAPRLRASGWGRWRTILAVGAVLSLQHLFLSFRPDPLYALWLAFRFLPFALWTGWVIDRRPTVLPYLMGAHALLDAPLAVLALMVSRGAVL